MIKLEIIATLTTIASNVIEIIKDFPRKLHFSMRKLLLFIVIPILVISIFVYLLFNCCNSAISILPGEYISFGTYPQTSMYPEPINWLVCSVNSGQVVLLSEYVLDVNQFGPNSLWDDSTIRKWLNSSFIERAFCPEEQDMLCVDSLGDKITLPELAFIQNLQQEHGNSFVSTVYTSYSKNQGGDAVTGFETYLTKTYCRDEEVYIILKDGGCSPSYTEQLRGVRPVIALQITEFDITDGTGDKQAPFTLKPKDRK